MSKSVVYLGLGSNAATKHHMLRRARVLINIYLGPITKQSTIYTTAPWGYLDQDDFINQVIEIESHLTVEELHQALLSVEKILGKQKDSKYGPRNIDIDILLFDQLIHNKGDLEIPHARMHERNFVLIPLSEIANGVIHPVLNKTIEYLASICEDSGSVIPQENES